MGQPTLSVYFSQSTPAADPGYRNAKPQSVIDGPDLDVSVELPNAWGVAVKTADYTLLNTDCGLLIVMNSGSAHTIKLPAVGSPILPPFADWWVLIQNIGTGVLTIDRNGLLVDAAAANLTLNQNQGVIVRTDGSNYFTERGMGSTAAVPTFADNEVLSGTIDGSNKTFTCLNSPNPPSSLHLYRNIDRIFPEVGSPAVGDYTISGNTVTMAVAPSIGDVLHGDYRY